MGRNEITRRPEQKTESKQPLRGDRRCMCHGDGIVEVGVNRAILTHAGNPLRTFEQNNETLWGPIGAACRCSHGQAMNELRDLKLPTYDIRCMRIVGESPRQAAEREDRANAEERKNMHQAAFAFDGVGTGGLELPDFGP